MKDLIAGRRSALLVSTARCAGFERRGGGGGTQSPPSASVPFSSSGHIATRKMYERPRGPAAVLLPTRCPVRFTATVHRVLPPCPSSRRATTGTTLPNPAEPEEEDEYGEDGDASAATVLPSPSSSTPSTSFLLLLAIPHSPSKAPNDAALSITADNGRPSSSADEAAANRRRADSPAPVMTSAPSTVSVAAELMAAMASQKASCFLVATAAPSGGARTMWRRGGRRPWCGQAARPRCGRGPRRRLREAVAGRRAAQGTDYLRPLSFWSCSAAQRRRTVPDPAVVDDDPGLAGPRAIRRRRPLPFPASAVIASTVAPPHPVAGACGRSRQRVRRCHRHRCCCCWCWCRRSRRVWRGRRWRRK